MTLFLGVGPALRIAETAAASSEPIQRLHRDQDGGAPNEFSFHPYVSPNGRFVSYRGSQGGTIGLFRVDLGSNLDPEFLGVMDNEASGGWRSDVADTGAVVAGTRTALLPADDNNTTDVYRFDDSGVRLVATAKSPSIDALGGVIALETNRRLVDEDNDQEADIYVEVPEGVFDRLTNGGDASRFPSVSADGSVVAFDSRDDSLTDDPDSRDFDVYVYDAATNDVEMVSLNGAGESANDDALTPAVSPDGQHVAFLSNATNLDATYPTSSYQIYIHDRSTGQTDLVSHAGVVPDGRAWAEAIGVSNGGQIVAFASEATNLIPGDTNGRVDVFVKNRLSGTVERVDAGEAPNGTSSAPTLSTDGSIVAFHSTASNLVDGDDNGVIDVFVAETGHTAGKPCGDASIIGVRGSGDSAFGDSYPGRHALSVADRLEGEWGFTLGDTAIDESWVSPDGVDSGVIGLTYPAASVLPWEGEFDEYGQSVELGVGVLRDLVERLRAEVPVGCGPDHPVVVVGFSQGAQVIQTALEEFDDAASGGGETWQSIAAAILVASPRFDPNDAHARGSFATDSLPRQQRAGICGTFRCGDIAPIQDRYRDVARTWCLAGDLVCQWPNGSFSAHTDAYNPGTPGGELILDDAAGLAAWSVHRRAGVGVGSNPTGGLDATRVRAVFGDNPVLVSAAAVYANGEPTDFFEWDFDSDGTVDLATRNPWVIHQYGYDALGPFGSGPGHEITKVTITHTDGARSFESICVNRQLLGPLVC